MTVPIASRYNAAGAVSGVVIVDAITGEPATAATPGSGGTVATPTYTAPGVLTASTDRSGTATTTSGGLSVPANASRTSLTGQNIGANNIGFNEQGGVAAIGTAGTYTVAPGASFSISTNKLINFIAATGNTAVSLTES